MDSNNVKGNLEKLGGKIKETVGELTGNEKLKEEAVQTKSRVQLTML